MKTLVLFVAVLALVITFTSALAPIALAQAKPQASQDLTQLNGAWKGRLGTGTADVWLKINVLPGGQIEGKLIFRGEEENISGSVKEDGGQLIVNITILNTRIGSAGGARNLVFRLILEKQGGEDVLSGTLLDGNIGYLNAVFYRSAPKPAAGRY